MTDRELLELAAKAAGIQIKAIIGDTFWTPTGLTWNALTDDADAFRLAGRLELDVMHRVVGGKRVEVLPAGGPLIQEFYEGEPYAAARRAIVRAAAEVARKRATKEA